MDVTLALAQAANVDASGNINALGLGWEVIGPSPLPPFVVIAVVRVPPEQAELPIAAELRMVDSDGKLVTQRDDPDRDLLVRNELKVAPAPERPPGLPAGVAMVVSMSAGLILDPGLYEWVLTVNGESRTHWRRRFYVRAKADEFPPHLRLESGP
ncbi:DUF6941 family protein [Streptomyces brasiliscabiei]|uniref:DUF6941 family protein n=1 Tax=Streptomyces brasiliscabiei TaxID=2736302 RepID=UPI003F687CCC